MYLEKRTGISCLAQFQRHIASRLTERWDSFSKISISYVLIQVPRPEAPILSISCEDTREGVNSLVLQCTGRYRRHDAYRHHRDYLPTKYGHPVRHAEGHLLPLVRNTPLTDLPSLFHPWIVMRTCIHGYRFPSFSLFPLYAITRRPYQ